MSDALVDTNVLLRLVLLDSRERADAARQYIIDSHASGDRLVLTPATCSEVEFALRGRRLAYSRAQIVSALERILELRLAVVDLEVVELAVAVYRDHHNDWDDCLLAAYALARSEGHIVSFDRGLDRIPGITRIEPAVA